MHNLFKCISLAAVISTATGFVLSINACRRPESMNKLGNGVKRRGHSLARHRQTRVTRNHEALNMRDRITDSELEAIRLDPSTLSEAERARLEGLRDIRMKLAEVEAKKRELAGASRRASQAKGREGAPAQAAAATKPAATTESPDWSAMSPEERKRAESLASIERSLAEVSEIQKQLGLSTDDAELEEREIEVADTDWSGQAGIDRVTGDGNRNWSDLPVRKWLAIGDVVALTLFAYVGRASHGDGSIGLDVVATALPFIAGWLVASPLLGAYTVSATSSVGDVGKTLVPAWGVSVPLALCIRALEKGGEVPPVAFVITSMIFTLVALGAWRALYTVVNPTSTDTYKRGGLLDGFRMITTLLRRW